MYGAHEKRTIGCREDASYLHSILLAERAGGEKGGDCGTQGDSGDVRERTYETPAGIAVCLRKRMPNGMGLID